MSLTAPLGLAAVALAVPLAVWYLLRTRRPRVEVASTLLWRRSNEAVTAAVPWQRFRPDRTFWLALAAILTGALALARPSVPVEAALRDHTIIVIDASASMLADEGGPSRLELARRQAEALVARLGPGQTVSVVEAADRARVALSASGDASAVRRALAGIRPSQGAADYPDALTLTAALQRPGESTSVLVLTDGVLTEAAHAVAPPGLQVVAVGTDRPNLAVTRMQAVPVGAGAADAFVQVRNFGALPVEARLVVAAGAAELDTRIVPLAPRGVEDLVIPLELPPGPGGAGQGAATVLRATVTPAGASEADGPAEGDGPADGDGPTDGNGPADGAGPADALAVDDTAYAVVAGGDEVVALVAGPGSVFVESALAAVDGVEVRTAPAVPADLTGVDLLVVDRIAAPSQPPVPTLVLAPAVPPDGVTAGAAVELPAVTFQDPDHELLRDVDLSSLAIATAQPVSSAALATVAGGPDGALIAAGRLGNQPLVYVAFDLSASNLPLQVAWPVLVANAVTWLVGPPVAAPVVAGTTVDLAPPPGATGVAVAPPGGDALLLDAANPRIVLDRVGVWQPRWLGDPEALATVPLPAPIPVNPVPEEGDLAPARPPAGTPVAAAADDPATPVPGRRVVGAGLLAAVLVLLLAEWALSHGVRPLATLRARRRRRVARALARQTRPPQAHSPQAIPPQPRPPGRAARRRPREHQGP